MKKYIHIYFFTHTNPNFNTFESIHVYPLFVKSVFGLRDLNQRYYFDSVIMKNILQKSEIIFGNYRTSSS